MPNTSSPNIDVPEPLLAVIDDDPRSLRSLELLLGAVHLRVKSFNSATSFLDQYDGRQWGCVITDLRMPGLSGMDLQQRLLDRKAPLQLVMISGFAELPLAVRAIKAGAMDFLEKPYSPQTLLDAVHRALEKQRQLLHSTAEHTEFEQRLATLSVREQQVLELLVAGQTSKSIAAALDVNHKTIDFHRRNLLLKLEVNSVVELGRWYEIHLQSTARKSSRVA